MGLITFFKGVYSIIRRQPEEAYHITVTEDHVRMDHPWWGVKQILWVDLQEIWLINTDKGPWLPDVWLTLIARNDSFKIPQGAAGYDAVYGYALELDGFNFENVIDAMGCTENARFLLWTRQEKKDQ